MLLINCFFLLWMACRQPSFSQDLWPQRCCDAVDKFVPFSARDIGDCSRRAGVIRRPRDPRSRFV